MKTIFNWISDDWRRIKNHCRTTDNKEFTEKDATDTFKKQLLISEHTPIRLLEFDWSWKQIKYFVAMEWARHKFEKFISTQRNDRQSKYDRNAARQDAPVNFDGYANMQSLIDAWRKRLCYQATPEARQLAEDFKIELHKTHPAESDVLVPNCVYRMGCPEFKSCGYYKYVVGQMDDLVNVFSIQKRYDAYNRLFYKEHKDDKQKNAEDASNS